MSEGDEYTEGEEAQDNGTTYQICVSHKTDDDGNGLEDDTIENLSKTSVKEIVKQLKEQIKAKEKYAIIEVDMDSIYIFRMFDILWM